MIRSMRNPAFASRAANSWHGSDDRPNRPRCDAGVVHQDVGSGVDLDQPLGTGQARPRI